MIPQSHLTIVGKNQPSEDLRIIDERTVNAEITEVYESEAFIKHQERIADYEANVVAPSKHTLCTNLQKV